MSDDERRRAKEWAVRSSLGPVFLTLVALGAGIGTVHRHRDVGAVLAAAVCVVFTVVVWRAWRNGRTHRLPRRPDE